jgi:hypothetical protein
MRYTLALVAALGLSGCVVPTVPGTSPGPQSNSLQQQLSGRQLVREGELHTLLPGGQVAGRFYDGPGDFYPVNGTWSVSGSNFCFGVEVSEPFCGPAEISGNRLTHYSDGGTMTWVIE